MDNNKKIIIIVSITILILSIVGGTLAYWSWVTNTNQRTNVTFTLASGYSCSADGGGNINSGEKVLIPTLVSNEYANNYIKRTVTVSPTIDTTGKTIYMDLWLDIKTLGTGLSNTNYFRYAFTTSSTSNTTGVIVEGTFNGKIAGDKIMLLNAQSFSTSTTDTYYLWIWLDINEEDESVMEQSFSLSLNGSCTDKPLPYSEDILNGGYPQLDDGMIPVVFDTTNGTVIKTVSNTDSSWYSYANKEWANAVLVKESGTKTRAYYKANPGVAIDESDILAYYVWVPRYKYKIWSVDDDKKNGKEQTIEIEFESTDSISTGTQVGEYITHPAFWWDTDSDGVRDDGEELAGIWVGKFETTGTASSPTILPDESSLTDQNVSTQFATAQKLGGTTYGVSSSSDSHMMKNSEWGAAAYLSHSKYGVNREVYINNSSLLYTGRSGGNVGGSTPINGTYTDQTSTDEYNSYGYYTWDGYLLNYNTNTKSSTRDLTKVASTTGNITGIYDMSGGATEYVMGVFANSDGQLWSGKSTSENSGFTGLLGFSGESYTGTAFPDSKYYDVYKASSGTTINELTACNGGACYGHALSETDSWYGDINNFVWANYPWLLRGGGYYYGSIAGVFHRYYDYGDGSSYIGDFRSVLSPIGA